MNRFHLTLTGQLDAEARNEVARLIGQERANEPIEERAGMVVEFRRAGSLQCGYLEQTPRGRNYRVIGVDGGLHRLRADKIVDRSRDHIAPHPANAGIKRLRALDALRDEARRDVDLDTLWRVVAEADPGRAWSLDELLELHNPEQTDATHRAGLLRALWSADRFERDGWKWRPRSEETVAEREAARLRQSAEQQLLEQQATWVRRIADGGAVDPVPAQHEQVIERLQVAAVGESTGESAELMQAAHLHGAPAALGVLIQLGRWSEHENLELHRLGVPDRFPDNLQGLDIECDDWRGSRRWGTQTWVEPGGERAYRARRRWLGGWTIDVHIAVPALALSPEIETEAARRGRTVRLVERDIPLLPPAVAQAVALNAQSAQPAVTLTIRLSTDLRIRDVACKASRMRPRGSLSAAPGQQLAALAAAWRDHRMANGAWDARPPHLAWDGSAAQAEPLPAGQVIDDELQTLAAEALGHWLTKRQLPALYRTREAPALGPLTEAPSCLRGFLLEGRTAAEQLAVDAAPHAGLALHHVAAGVRPLHDHADLIVQRQILAHLIGADLLATEDLERAVLDTRSAREAAYRVEAASRRYWGLQWLDSLGAHATVPATVVEPRGSGYLVLLDDVPVAGHAQSSNGERIELTQGQAVNVQIGHVSARQDELRLIDPVPA